MSTRPLIYKRRYKCARCGLEKFMNTTHKGSLHSWGDANRCPVCKQKKIKERTVWICQQK